MNTDLIIRMFLNLFFYMTAAIIIHSLLFLQVRLAKLVFLNCFSMLLFLAPQYLAYHNFILSDSTDMISITGFLLFPLTYTLMILKFYDLTENHSMIPVSLVVLSALFLSILFPDETARILMTQQIIMSVFILYVLTTINLNTPLKIIGAAQVINCINALISFATNNFINMTVSTSLLALVTFYILSLEYQGRLSKFIRQLKQSNELNRKLTHQITRLKQSNDQCRQIIAEKYSELFQIARHASLAEITTGIAHELAQPLTGIKGIAQNMIDDFLYEEFDSTQAVTELQKISSLVDKSSSIINHIRNFSKKTGVSMKTIDLNIAIIDAIDLINHQLKKNDIELVCHFEDVIPMISGDAISIEQLIVNFLLNAKDAIIEKKNFQKETEGKIEISTAVHEKNVRLVIRDNGTGIPKDIIPKIWSPFFTSKKRTHGTGVGLSICSRIIKEHNAEVQVDSSSSGTLFIIDFPIPEE